MSDQDIRDRENQEANGETAQGDTEKRRKAMLREVFSWVRTLGIAVIAALLVRMFIFTPALVKGRSMQDTLYTNQLMAVFRCSYWFSEPERGDVVFCRYPGWTEDCVKRVIGLPGERVRVQDSIVYIDGVALEEPYLTRPESPDFDEITVPEDSYFVMGDNRSYSTDSRAVGALEMQQIEGHCAAVIWPVTQWKAL